jgi:hypothetical protein
VFAPSVVQAKLDRFEKEFGWRPREHSIAEVDAWTKRLGTAFQIDQKGVIFQTRSLTRIETAFVANERAMCVASCLYFLTRYYWIKTKSSIVRFAFRQGQWILWQMLCQLDEKGFSKLLQILKARQLGISTLAEGIMTWGALFIPGVSAQIGSADGQKTQIMLGMMTLAIDQLPPWLPPTQTRSKVASDRALLEFSRVGSLIMVQPGSIRGGMGQGATPTMVHLSEVSQYTNPVSQLDEGLFKALHEGPELVVMLESTGDAAHQSAWWWKEQWIANRDNYWAGRAKFLPVFLPWHTTPELYPGKSWLEKFPIPSGWEPNEDTVGHIRRAEAYVQSTEMLRQIIGHHWHMPREQQWFWEFNHEDHKRRRVEKSWYRQMPCDDYEALLGERDKVASEHALEVMGKTIKPHADVGVYMLVGDGVADHREPDQSLVWYGNDSPPRLRFDWSYTTRKGAPETMDWDWIPLKPQDEKSFDPLEKLLLYEEPREGFDYSIGADTGTGVGGDRTIINVTRYGSDAEPDEQVAEYASDSIPAAEIYTWLAAIAAFYSKHFKDPHSRWRHPKIAIEMKRKFGDTPYHVCRLMQFRRWHEWGHGFDRKTFEDKVGKHGRMGWFTNEWSRPMLLSAFQAAVENGWYRVRSKYLQREITEQEQRVMASGKTRVDHEQGGHDDRVFAAAMAYFTLHQHDVMAERAKKRYDEPEDEGELIIERGPAVLTVPIDGGRLWASR